MSKTKMHVRILASDLHSETSVHVNAAFLKKWKFSAEQSVALRFGLALREVRLIGVTNLTGMRLSPQLAASFGIGTDCTLNAYRTGTRSLSIGPLIGVMLRKIKSGPPEQLFGKNASFCTEITQACREYGAYVFFFTPEEIRADYSGIAGWTLDGNVWAKRTMPIPNIVYNRLTSRVLEDSDKVQTFMKMVKSRGTHIFNEKYLHKNEVFEALRREQQLTPSLPESHSLRSASTLHGMLSRHSTVFLKPIKGSLGRGILRVRRTQDGYQCDATAANGIRRQSFGTFEKLSKSLGHKIKSGTFQIQQGLQLVEVDGRPVDFRAVVQRGSTGEWSVTSIVARIAGNRTFVSNLARGGSLSTVADTLAKSNLPRHLQSAASAKLRSVAVDIAKGIETQIQSHFAEFGVDLAVDTRGNVWLIEVNSKPSKEDNSPLEPGKVRPSVKKIVKYSIYLARHRSSAT